VAAIAKGLEDQFGDRIAGGCIITKYGHTEQLSRIRQVQAGHPIPDEQGVRGTRMVLDMLEELGSNDRVFVLVTGGASALLVAPAPPISLADKAAVTSLLIRSNASIEEINTVRQALSEVKAGRLLERIFPAQSMTLLISDIPSGDLSKIGSGPTIKPSASSLNPVEILERYDVADKLPASVMQNLSEACQDSSARPVARGEAVLMADSAALIEAIDRGAAALGLAVRHVDLAMTGNTHAAAHDFAAAMVDYARGGLPRPCLFVSAGETTLQVRGGGLGGRNQEFALTAARHLAGVEGCVLLAAGTDGTDGPTSAAGGYADWTTCERATRAELSVEEFLADNDSHSLLGIIGDLHTTGPTGTNVMDLVLGLVV
jgi:glycerate 2-kinase